MHRSTLIRTATALAATAAVAAPAVAIAATPAGKATTLNFTANAGGPPINGRIPSSFSFSAPGFSFDPRAVAKRCSQEAAVLNECPAKSTIGAGSLLVHVVSATFARNTTVPINLYLESNTRVLGVAFIGGPHAVTATLKTGGGVTLTFDLPKVPSFPGVTLTLQQIGIKLGANRVVVTHVHKRVHGKKKTITKRTKYYLIHAPKSCSGSWSSTVTLGFPDGSTAAVTTPIACS